MGAAQAAGRRDHLPDHRVLQRPSSLAGIILRSRCDFRCRCEFHSPCIPFPTSRIPNASSGSRSRPATRGLLTLLRVSPGAGSPPDTPYAASSMDPLPYSPPASTARNPSSSPPLTGIRVEKTFTLPPEKLRSVLLPMRVKSFSLICPPDLEPSAARAPALASVRPPGDHATGGRHLVDRRGGLALHRVARAGVRGIRRRDLSKSGGSASLVGAAHARTSAAAVRLKAKMPRGMIVCSMVWGLVPISCPNTA
jgi:hypothetical protein